VAPAQGSINIWTSQGPPAGSVAALAIDPTTPTTLYAVAARDVSAANGRAATSANRIDVCGPINADTTWTPANLYVITCEVTVAKDVTLTVMPGTVVKAYYGGYTPCAITVFGRLVAEGTSEAPIVFTSIHDDEHGGDTENDGSATVPGPGNWQSINLEAGSSGSISNALIAYGGWWYWYDNPALVRCNDADIKLDRVTLRAGSRAALSARRCSIEFTNGTMADNGSGLEVFGLAAGAPFTLANNVFGPGAAGVVAFDGNPHGPVSIHDNVAVDGKTGLNLRGTLKGDLDWHNDELVLLLVEGLTVAPEATLRLAPGSVVKSTLFDYGPGAIEVNGTLLAEGTPAAPIVFTSIRDDEHGGDTNADGSSTTAGPGQWSGVTVNAGGAARIVHAEILYGGNYYFFFGSNALVRAVGGEASLDDVTLRASGWNAIYAENGAVRVSGSRMEDNWWNVYNQTPKVVVDARRNWWGDPSGPHHATKNPNGQGKDVTDGVLFFPWAIDADGTEPSQVHVEGPTVVSPGGPAEYAVYYYAGEDLGETVLTLQLPLTAEYVEDPTTSDYWFSRHEAFWKLGPLAAGSDGTRSARVRFRWGLPNRLSDSALGVLRSATADESVFSPAPYLAYVPPRVLDERPLSGAEIDTERQAHPDVDAHYRDAEAGGFKSLGGTSLTISDGSEMVELVFIRPDAAIVVRRIGQTILRYRVDANTWSVGDRSGGLTYDATLGRLELSGGWDTSSGVRAAPASPNGACIGNCLLVAPFDEEVWSLDVYKEIVPYLQVVRSPQCRDFYSGSASQEACLAVVKSAIQGGARLLGLTADDCFNDCRQDETKYRCEAGEDASVCLRQLSTDARSFVNVLLSVFLPLKPGQWGQPYYETFSCVDGVFQSVGTTACRYPDPQRTIVCQGRRIRRRGLLIPRAQCGYLYYGLDACVFEPSLRGDVSHDQRSSDGQCAPAGGVKTAVRSAHDPNAKSGPAGDVVPTQELTYTVEYENVGEGTAYGVYITDELSPHLDETTLELNNDQGKFFAATRTILWDIGDLAPKGQEGSKGERTFRLTVKPGLPSGTVITNQAIVYFPSVPEETATNTVVNVVEPLAALPQSLETPYGTPIGITLSGHDVSAAPLTYTIEEQPLNGELTGTAPNLTYTPGENFTGQDRLTFTVSNGVSESRTADVTILVTPSSADTIAPELVWTYPENGAVIEEVPTAPVFTDDTGPVYAPSVLAGFSEAMDEKTITGSTLRVITGAGREVQASVLWDGTMNQAVLAPREAWQDGSYTATVTTGARDASGNALAADYSWSFRIGASTCTGECNDNGEVTIDELLTLVNIALGNVDVMTCAAGDANRDKQVTIDEILVAVNNALNGCP
jgi:hypothetical protein